MPTAKIENYTAEMTKDIVTQYQSQGTDLTEDAHNARAKCVKALSEQYGKNERSIRSKLVTQKVYIKRATVSTVTGEPAEKKEVMAKRVASAFGVEVIDGKEHRLSADSLEKMNKPELAVLFHRFNSEIVDEVEAEVDEEVENHSQVGETASES